MKTALRRTSRPEPWCWLVVLLGWVFPGCALLPEIAHQPTLHNPYPQLSKVAVAPFFNLSTEPTVDGRQFALAYQNELQLVPGFEVVPVGVVERTIQQRGLTLQGPRDARRLAQLLGVDVLVVGAVTDYSPYYPPRCAMQVEWYAANPCFHPIPPGYGLPWGTPEEEGIPGPLVLQAEMALAREQLKTQTPSYAPEPLPPPLPLPTNGGRQDGPEQPAQPLVPSQAPAPERPGAQSSGSGLGGVQAAGYSAPAGTDVASSTVGPGRADAADGKTVRAAPGLPPNWPDPRGFIPPPPGCRAPSCWPSDEPVMRHTQTYNGHDGNFTEALSSYYFFRDDARFGGWQSYLQRSDDFIRFCCHMHLWEMLSARGGAGQTRVVWRWRTIR